VPEAADFGAGTVNGQVSQFVIVPEPGTLVFAGIGITIPGWASARRRRVGRMKLADVLGT
jgi:hypothetical protein